MFVYVVFKGSVCWNCLVNLAYNGPINISAARCTEESDDLDILYHSCSFINKKQIFLYGQLLVFI